MWGYGASHMHCTSGFGLGLCMRSCDALMKCTQKNMKCLSWRCYDITLEHEYEYTLLLFLYGLVYVLIMCINGFQRELDMIILKSPFVHVFKWFTCIYPHLVLVVWTNLYSLLFSTESVGPRMKKINSSFHVIYSRDFI